MDYLTAWNWGTAELDRAGVRDARWDAELLLRHCAGVSRAQFLAYPERALNEQQIERFRAAIWERSVGVPVQYIVGSTEFYGREFVVTPAVLIPRPDTEVLVEEAIRRLSALSSQLSKEGLQPPASSLQPLEQSTVNSQPSTPLQSPPLQLLDLCTGSGCIGLSIAVERGDANVTLGDISGEALEVARTNAERLGLAARVEIVRGDLFAPVRGRKFDVIVSNPPYISTEEIPTLDMEVQSEPILALDGGPDGLQFYRRIASEAPMYLNPGGWLLLEVGHTQGIEVSQLLKNAGFLDVEVSPDLAGRDRVVVGRIALSLEQLVRSSRSLNDRP